MAQDSIMCVLILPHHIIVMPVYEVLLLSFITGLLYRSYIPVIIQGKGLLWNQSTLHYCSLQVTFLVGVGCSCWLGIWFVMDGY